MEVRFLPGAPITKPGKIVSFFDHEREKDLFPLGGSHLLPKEARIFTRELAQFVFEKKD
jgi:hypothetical protein